MGLTYNSVPFGSILTVPKGDQDELRSRTLDLPKQAREMLFAGETGAYIRGLTKQYSGGEEKSSVVSLAVLRLSVGDLKTAELSDALEKDLKLSTDKAQAMAAEIEHDLFGPIKDELEKYWKENNSPSRPEPAPSVNRAPAADSNVLDLKNANKPPAPPPMPGKL